MKTKIRTVHEEGLSNNTKNVGVLVNYSETNDWFESFIYLYNNMNYIFFETIDDLNMYLYYSDKKIKRAYLEEKEFDTIYDAKILNGKFGDKLEWILG